MSNRSRRAHNEGPQSPVAQARRELYSFALKRVDDALSKGFALEAVTLVESMIADRLEARCAKVFPADPKMQQFSNLGPLTDRLLADKAGESTAMKALYRQVKEWADDRNEALHELVKLAENSDADWDSKYTHATETAKAGLELFRSLDTQVKKLNQPE
jgi:hypothetical protein